MVKFPKCNHENQIHCEETSYEWFETCCDDCYVQWKKDKRIELYKWVKSQKGRRDLESNKFGNYSLYTPDTTGRSITGEWLRGVVIPDEVELFDSL